MTELTRKEIEAKSILANYAKFLPSMPPETTVVLERDTAMTLDLHNEEARAAMESSPWAVKVRTDKDSPYKLTTGGLSTTVGALILYLGDRIPTLEVPEDKVEETEVPDYLLDDTDEEGGEA